MIAAIFLLAAQLIAPPARAETKVVVSIGPIHSLAAAVMAGAGAPQLLVKGSASEHTYALKPSDTRNLNTADLIIRVSARLETFLVKVLAALPKTVEVVTLDEIPGLTVLPQRGGGLFEADHDHDDEGHGHDTAHEHPPATAAGPTQRHDSHARHDAVATDPHLWLDVENAKIIVNQLAEVLARRDPPLADLYRANAKSLRGRLDLLSLELKQTLQPLAGKPYVVFHDGYQYFEARFGLAALASLTLDPQLQPGPRRLAEIRAKIKATGALCVFSEPQFEPKLIAPLIEGTGARTGTLDGLGAGLEPGPELYFQLMRGLASGLRACLAPG